MLRCFNSLVLKGVLLHLVFPAFVVATPDGKIQHTADIPPAHSHVDISSTQMKTSGASEHIPDSQAETSQWKPNIATDIPKITDQTLDVSHGVQKRDTHSPLSSFDVFIMSEAFKTLSEKVERLSEELKRQKTAVVEGFEALKQISDKMHDELHDQAERFTEFDKTTRDRLDKIETSLQQSRQSAESLKRIEASIDKNSIEVNEKLNTILDDVLLVTKSAAVTVKALSTIETQISRGVERAEVHDLIQRFNESAEVSRAIRASIGEQQVHLAEIKEDIERKLDGVETSINSVRKSLTRADANEENILDTLSEIRDVKSYLRTLDKSIGNSNSSKAFFHVQNITRHMDKANVSGSEIIYSDFFVIKGYTAGLSVYLQPHESTIWIRIALFLCAGPHDAFLEWPFRMDYDLSLVHPRDPIKDVTYTLRSSKQNISRCKGHFDRTALGCKNGCATDPLISRDSAEKDGYIYNDAITVGVTLRA